MHKKKVLFLCTGNSCRSQMAEGLARHLKSDKIEAHSAGTAPQALNPSAVIVMSEIGIDISAHRSKRVDELGTIKFDYVITVCDDANEHCPIWPGRGRLVHHSFDDPPRLALNAQSNDEKLMHYRRVRDEIRSYIQSLPESLPQDTD